MCFMFLFLCVSILIDVDAAYIEGSTDILRTTIRVFEIRYWLVFLAGVGMGMRRYGELV